MDTHFVYFSPTNTTKDVLHTMFGGSSFGLRIVEHDLTDSQHSGVQMDFSMEDLTIWGIPVYSGRVPKVAIDRFRNLSGNKTPAILVATYGNRNYDDALIELYDILTLQGFVVIAAAAIVAEHSVVRRIAVGRPNTTDRSVIRDFAETIMSKELPRKLDTPLKGNRPYCKYQSVPFKPKANNKCIYCGLCVKLCPVNAISKEEPKCTNKSICISCMRCVRFCQKGARGFSKVEEYIAYKFISKKCREEKENTLFI